MRIAERYTALAPATLKFQLHIVVDDGAGDLVPLTTAAVALRDVLAGDVWLCSGQSNMEMAVVKARDHDREIRAADHPRRVVIDGQQVEFAVQPPSSQATTAPTATAPRWR